MDIGYFFQMAAELFLKICSIRFTVFGYSVSAASVFIFAGLVVIVGSLLRRLGD